MADATASGSMMGGRAERPAPPAPVLAADGRPLRASLARSLRRQKLRALLLIAPLLLFIVVTFVLPIGDMLLRSVENRIVADTLPRTVAALREDPAPVPGEAAFRALASDLAVAVERKVHTQLGTRLNYEASGMSSLLRGTGRDVGEWGEDAQDAIEGLDPAWGEAGTWAGLMAAGWLAERDRLLAAGGAEPPLALDPEVAGLLPRTAESYGDWARLVQAEGDSPAEEEPWPLAFRALAEDLRASPGIVQGVSPEFEAGLGAILAGLEDGAVPVPPFRDLFAEADGAWGEPGPWSVLRANAAPWTAGYFLNAVDLRMTPDGLAQRPADERIHLMLFARTLWMSLLITACCVALGYPVAFLLASLPMRRANLLMILVLLPFWTSLLVRTSAWKVLLQQQGVVNDVLVSIGLVDDGARLLLINNQLGTVIAMTHILLPFMILPLYSVMRGIPPSYLRAAKSLGANDWTAFWRVYFPQSMPGIGAGSILVFILSIGYYITPELVGGTRGVFISNRIAYHISSSLNWGLAAALGTILLVVVLLLYWAYDRLVGIDNVKLGG
jgi:putative spermidine/putrescine transport system permease protein